MIEDAQKSVKLSVNIKVAENGTIYRLASFVIPPKSGKPSNEGPQLYGSAELTNDLYPVSI